MQKDTVSLSCIDLFFTLIHCYLVNTRQSDDDAIRVARVVVVVVVVGRSRRVDIVEIRRVANIRREIQTVT